MKIIKQSAALEYITPNALEFIEKIGRVCYKSEGLITPDSSEEFIKMLLNPDKKHESVLEHAHATFRFITDRGVTHEIVRHRIASYSQESTRYCNYSKDKFGKELTIILPVRHYATHDLNSTVEHADWLKYTSWSNGMFNCEETYFNLIELGEKPQEARDVLPNSLKTEIVMTANFREWRHFFKLRTSKAAHPQMQELANQALQLVRNEVKIIFDELN